MLNINIIKLLHVHNLHRSTILYQFFFFFWINYICLITLISHFCGTYIDNKHIFLTRISKIVGKYTLKSILHLNIVL